MLRRKRCIDEEFEAAIKEAAEHAAQDGIQFDAPPTDEPHPEHAEQGDTLGYADLHAPLIKDIDGWAEVMKTRKRLPIASLINNYPLMEKHGRQAETEFIKEEIYDRIQTVIDRYPDALSKKDPPEEQEFIARNKRAIRSYLGDELQEYCHAAALGALEWKGGKVREGDRFHIRSDFTVFMHQKTHNAFTALRATIRRRDTAERTLASLVKLEQIASEKAGEPRFRIPEPKRVRQMLKDFERHVAEKQRAAYQNHINGGAALEDDYKQRSVRRRIEKAAAAISEKIGKPFTRDDIDNLLFLTRPIDPRIDAMR